MEPGTAAGSMLESWIPIREVSRDAAIEMSFKPVPAYLARCRELGLQCRGRDFYDPKIRSLHPWLARRPRSVARALNLAAALPPDTSAEEFLRLMGFARERLAEAVSRGYPPLISYVQPDTEAVRRAVGREVTVLDPMAGGGTIPLEAALLGMRAIACDYNPVAYLILRATVEFPARYGLELWRRLVDEVRRLMDYATRELSPYYDSGAEGYIMLRQVRVGGRVIPLQDAVQLSSREHARVGEDGSVRLVRGAVKVSARRELLRLWMEQHGEVMGGRSELYGVVHRCAAVQTQRGFRVPEERDAELLERAYSAYLSRLDSLSVPDVPIPVDNEVFSDVLPLGSYRALFSPRQALALDVLVSYVRRRVGELVEEGEFGAAVGLYLALGVDRVADFNSVVTTWNHNTLTVRDSAGSYYKFRKLRLEGIYAEAVVPHRTLAWVFEPDSAGRTAGGICPVVRELAERLEGRGHLVETYMCDATQMSRHFGGIDVVNVDPPYYDQHAYGDFSEFFWPLLRVMLEPVLPLLFGRRVLVDWEPTSWRVPRSSEIVARRGDGRAYEAKLERALREARAVLRDDGLLILWFSHRSMEAWDAVARALAKSGFSVTAIVPFPSEHPTRSVTRGGRVGINRVLVVAARKRETVGMRVPEEIVARLRGYLAESRLYPEEEIPEEEVRVLTETAERALWASTGSRSPAGGV